MIAITIASAAQLKCPPWGLWKEPNCLMVWTEGAHCLMTALYYLSLLSCVPPCLIILAVILVTSGTEQLFILIGRCMVLTYLGQGDPGYNCLLPNEAGNIQETVR